MRFFSVIYQGRFVILTAPSVTGPATPKQAELIVAGFFLRNARTMSSNPEYALLSYRSVTPRSNLPFSLEYRESLVFVPPTSPARIIAPPASILHFTQARKRACEMRLASAFHGLRRHRPNR